MKVFRLIAFILLIVGGAFSANAQRRHLNDKLLNRPYADNRAWHLGFSIGMHTQNLIFTHNGFISPDGQQWLIEQPSYAPGFCVTGLVDLRLNSYFSFRFSPGLYFGNRNLRMLDINSQTTERQSLKSTYVVLPCDLKYSSVRLRNIRPYIVGGFMPAFDVSKKQNEFIQIKPTDFFLTIGFGCDFYLPFFKLIPELKFCFGLTDVLQHDRPDLSDDPYKPVFTQSLKKATSKLIVLSFYFE